MDIRQHGMEVERLQAEIVRLESLLVAHHAVGIMDGSLIGDRCPVCWPLQLVADDVLAEEEDQPDACSDERKHDVLP